MLMPESIIGLSRRQENDKSLAATFARGYDGVL